MKLLSFTIYLSLYFMFVLFVIDSIICFSVMHSFSCIVVELFMTISKFYACRCIRNGNYDEALDLEAFVSKISKLHPE